MKSLYPLGEKGGGKKIFAVVEGSKRGTNRPVFKKNERVQNIKNLKGKRQEKDIQSSPPTAEERRKTVIQERSSRRKRPEENREVGRLKGPWGQKERVPQNKYLNPDLPHKELIELGINLCTHRLEGMQNASIWLKSKGSSDRQTGKKWHEPVGRQ